MAAGSTKNIVIVGNSGFARECFLTLRKMKEAGSDIAVRGFLSFEGYSENLKELASMQLCDDEAYAFGPDDYAVIGLGGPKLRHKAYYKLKEKGVRFFTIVHPKAYVDHTTTLGEGNIFCARSYVTCNCAIGSGNVFNGPIHVGHDTVMGDCNFVGPGAQILGCVSMGSMNSVGALSVLLPKCRIGNGNIIAPLSAVYKGCRDNVYLAGNPAVKVGQVHSD